MPSLFTRIVQGEIPAHKVGETEHYLAFLDIRPMAEGHTLVIPKKEVDYLFDLDDELLQGLWVFAKKVARAIEQEVRCKRIGVAVVGLEVPHAHVHLMPINDIGDLTFAKEPLSFNQEELAELAGRIRQRYSEDST